MVGAKRFKGLAHDIAHHSASSLSWLHPHLAEACQKSNTQEVTIDLLSQTPYPHSFSVTKPLALAIEALKKKFQEITSAIGLDYDNIEEATLYFSFSSSEDKYCCHVTSRISVNGKEYSALVHS